MFEATEKFNIKNATFNFFESHEGKSTSDTIGSIVKCAFIRATFKSEQGITDIDDILGLINSEIKPSTKKFDFVIAEKFGRFPKKTSNSRNFCKVPGIMGLYSFKLCGDKISLLELTCTECSNEGFCPDCSSLKLFTKDKVQKPDRVELITIDEQEEQEDGTDDENNLNDNEDEGQTDASSDESDDE